MCGSVVGHLPGILETPGCISSAEGRAGDGVGGEVTVEDFLTTQKLSLYFRTTTKEHWGGKQVLTAKDWCEVGFGH